MNKPEAQELKDQALATFAEETGFTPNYLAVVDRGTPDAIEWALICALKGGMRMTERALLAEQENAVLKAQATPVSQEDGHGG